MNAQQKLLFRNCLLVQLNETQTATPVSTLTQGARVSGYRVTDEDVARELRYLSGEGKELCEEFKSPLSKGHSAWLITSAGTDYLEEQGLA